MKGVKNMDDTKIYLDDDDLLFVITMLKSKFAPFEHNHNGATEGAAGFMSAADKKKLDGIAKNATKTEISDVINDLSTDLTAASSKAVREYVKSALADITGFSGEIVESLPETGEDNVIYLVPKTSAKGNDVHNEYMWINGAFELIGTTAVDLSGYLKTSDLRPMTNEEIENVFTAAGL